MNKIYFSLCFYFLLTSLPIFAQNSNTSTLLLNQDFARFEISQELNQQEIEICGFEKNENYDIWIAGEHSSFLAAAECAYFPILNLTNTNSWISVSKKNYTADQSAPQKSIANIQTDDSFNEFELISDIFIGGNCFEVENVAIIGNDLGIGYFSEGTESIGIENGIILASGDIANASGPNNSNSAGSTLSGTNVDPDLDILATSNVNDAVGIEFDFTPTTEMIEFQYVFASEEYCEYVNSAYNDVFGFFISGPGFNGPFALNGENIALVPNSNEFVAINSINHLQNWPLFVPNNINCGIDATHPNTIQYDGATVVLTALAQVIPCETYHIRMVVGDVNDALYDSAVFLKANSFSAGGSAVVEANSSFTGTNTAYEGCENGEFIFSRDSDDVSEDLVINYTVLGTATPISDYGFLPDSITIPAGQMSYTLPVEIIVDNQIEGSETLILEVPASCSCSESMVEMVILDVEPLAISPANPTTCLTEPVTLSVVSQGGMPNYTYLWSTGETNAEITVTPNGIGTEIYNVTVTDECGNQTIGQSTVNAVAPPEANISGQGTHCIEDNNTFIEFPIELTGEGPWEVSYRYNGVLQTPITVTSSPYILSVNGVGTYALEGVSYAAGYCPGYVTGQAEIMPTTPPTATISGEGGLCPEDTNTFIELPIHMTGDGPWEITYRFNNQIQPTITANTSPYFLPVNTIGSYTLESVSFLNGLCQGDVFGIAEVVPATPPSAFISGTGDLCPNENGTLIELPIELTGSGPWEITYSYNDIPQNTITVSETPYLLAVDAIGNYALENVSYAGGLCPGGVSGLAQITETIIFLETETTPAECPDDNTGSILLTGSGGTQPYTFTWENTSISGNQAQSIFAGNYPVTMTDAYGCVAETTAFVEQPERIVATPFKTEGLCEGDKGSIEFMDVQGGTPDYIYSISGGDNFSSNTLFTNLEGADYELVIQDLNGCEWEDEIKIIDPERIELYANPGEAIDLGETYQIDIQTNISNSEIIDITWTNVETLDCEDCLDPIANPYHSTEYRITITTDKGCLASTSLVVQVDKSDLPVFIPSAFSPNNDGVNDFFTIFASENAVTNIKKLEIYSRWGDRVFNSENFAPNDLFSGWNGEHRGKDLNGGVFIWYAEIEFVDGNTEMYKGDISLVR